MITTHNYLLSIGMTCQLVLLGGSCTTDPGGSSSAESAARLGDALSAFKTSQEAVKIEEEHLGNELRHLSALFEAERSELQSDRLSTNYTGEFNNGRARQTHLGLQEAQARLAESLRALEGDPEMLQRLFSGRPGPLRLTGAVTNARDVINSIEHLAESSDADLVVTLLGRLLNLEHGAQRAAFTRSELLTVLAKTIPVMHMLSLDQADDPSLNDAHEGDAEFEELVRLAASEASAESYNVTAGSVGGVTSSAKPGSPGVLTSRVNALQQEQTSPVLPTADSAAIDQLLQFDAKLTHVTDSLPALKGALGHAFAPVFSALAGMADGQVGSVALAKQTIGQVIAAADLTESAKSALTTAFHQSAALSVLASVQTQEELEEAYIQHRELMLALQRASSFYLFTEVIYIAGAHLSDAFKTRRRIPADHQITDLLHGQRQIASVAASGDAKTIRRLGPLRRMSSSFKRVFTKVLRLGKPQNSLANIPLQIMGRVAGVAVFLLYVTHFQLEIYGTGSQVDVFGTGPLANARRVLKWMGLGASVAWFLASIADTLFKVGVGLKSALGAGKVRLPGLLQKWIPQLTFRGIAAGASFVLFAATAFDSILKALDGRRIERADRERILSALGEQSEAPWAGYLGPEEAVALASARPARLASLTENFGFLQTLRSSTLVGRFFVEELAPLHGHKEIADAFGMDHEESLAFADAVAQAGGVARDSEAGFHNALMLFTWSGRTFAPGAAPSRDAVLSQLARASEELGAPDDYRQVMHTARSYLELSPAL